MTDLTIDTETFRVEVDGDTSRPALMLSNSLGADLSMWDGQLAALSAHFRVIRYDPRGHGGSVAGTGSVSIAQLGRDALAILDALEIEKAHWLGVSMGGAVGLWLLANAPERIDRAILANTAPRFGSPGGWNARITAVLADGMEQTAAATIERWFSPGFAQRAPQRTEATHDVLRKTSPEGYAACCAALRDMDLRESLLSIEHDVLVITGRDDPVVPAEDAKTFIRAISGARHVVLEARHLSNIEAEADFNTAVLAFLTAKPARKRVKSAALAKPARKAAPRKAAAAAKATPAKRGSATRRSNAARNPLKKTAAKAIAAKGTASKGLAAKKAGTGVAPTKKKLAEVRRRPVTKAIAKSRTTPKVAAKKPPPKPARKTATARRPTPTSTARSAVKVAARSAVKVAARPARKAAIKKAKPRKTIAKTIKKIATKTLPKKVATARRKPVAKPRRPTGRRKP